MAEGAFSSPDAGGYVPKVIFSYSLSHLPQSKKVSFFYGLKGRGANEGLIKRCGVQQLGRGALLVPAKHADEVEAFLRKWGCDYTKRGALVTA